MVTNFFLLLLCTTCFTLLINKGIQSKKDYIEIIWLSPINTVILGPVWEEVLFRGLPILLGENNPFGWIMIISSSLFALIHLKNVEKGKILLLIDVFVFASVMAWVTVNWGILYAILMHIINNAIAYLLICLYFNKRNRMSYSPSTTSLWQK